MKMKLFLSVVGISSLALAITAWAAVPAPPVNQNLGIMDVSFTNLMEDDCRVCHGPNPPPGVPVDPTYLPDRHHLLVDTPIEDNPSVDLPNPDADGDGVPDTTYDCLNCHSLFFDSNTGTWELDPNFRDCLECHVASPHHVTTEAQAGDCQACHGSLVDDGLSDDDNDGIRNAIDPDGGWVPTYIASLVTPYPGGAPDNGVLTGLPGNVKPNGGITNPINGAQEGNCTYCHDAGLESGVGNIQANNDNHHDTGFGPPDGDTAKCIWCHSFDDPNEDIPIRTCENCHGIPSVHNIQTKTDGTPADGTIIPGAEDPGYGHIGSQDDCNGCHGNNGVPQSASPGGPVIPQIESVTPATATAGQPVTLTITGQALTNLIPNPMGGEDMLAICDLVLEAGDGTETVVAASSISESSMTVDVSALAAGNYTVRAKKFQKISNPIILPVLPAVTIDSTTCIGTTATITGNGFVSFLDAANSGTDVSGTVEVTTYDKKGRPHTTTTTETGVVSYWSGSEIVAVFSSCPADVTVNSVYGSATSGDGGDPPTGSCSDYGNEAECNGDSACAWSDKKGGSCKDAGSGGGGGGKPPKDK